jgi:hypothetical protein
MNMLQDIRNYKNGPKLIFISSSQIKSCDTTVDIVLNGTENLELQQSAIVTYKNTS